MPLSDPATLRAHVVGHGPSFETAFSIGLHMLEQQLGMATPNLLDDAPARRRNFEARLEGVRVIAFRAQPFALRDEYDVELSGAALPDGMGDRHEQHR